MLTGTSVATFMAPLMEPMAQHRELRADQVHSLCVSLGSNCTLSSFSIVFSVLRNEKRAGLLQPKATQWQVPMEHLRAFPAQESRRNPPIPLPHTRAHIPNPHPSQHTHTHTR